MGFVAVPTASSPPLPELSEALELELGERLPEGLTEAEGDCEELGEVDRLAEALGLRLPLAELLTELLGLRELLGLMLALGDKETLALGDSEPEGELDKLLLGLVELDGEADELGLEEAELLGEREALGLSETDSLALGDKELLGEVEAEGLSEALVALIVVATLPKILSRTAPVTVNRVAVPTAPEPVLALKVIVFKAWIDQSVLVTGALFLFTCWSIFIILLVFF